MDDELLLVAGLRQALEMGDPPEVFFDPDEARRIVKANGLSQEAIGLILGVSTFTVGGWLRAEHVPSRDKEAKYQKLLHLLDRRARLLDGQLETGLQRLLAAVGKEVAA